MNSGLAYEENDVTWVLTVPAIWDEPAKQFMQEAAEKVSSAINPICTLLLKNLFCSLLNVLLYCFRFYILFSKYVTIHLILCQYMNIFRFYLKKTACLEQRVLNVTIAAT